MIGAILGDIAGSRYEFLELKRIPEQLWTKEDFFTDDSILTCATAWALLGYNSNKPLFELQKQYLAHIKDLVDFYPNVTWGSRFLRWVAKLPEADRISAMSKEQFSKIKFADSFGNGCAMKIAPVAYAAYTIERVKTLSKALTQVTHNSKEGIFYAEAVATTVFVALNTSDKKEVKDNIYKYCPELQDVRSYEELQKGYHYSELAKDTIPAALYCFIVSQDFEDAVKKAIGLGGDADTLAAITGAVAEAFYKYSNEKAFIEANKLVNPYLAVGVDKLDMPPLQKITSSFYNRFGVGKLLRAR